MTHIFFVVIYLNIKLMASFLLATSQIGIMVSDDEEEYPYTYYPPNPNIPQVLTPMTNELWDIVIESIEPLDYPLYYPLDYHLPGLLQYLTGLYNLNYILQWSFGNDRVAMRENFLHYQVSLFDREEEISVEDQDWTDELLDNLDDAFIAIDNLNENMHLYKNI